MLIAQILDKGIFFTFYSAVSELRIHTQNSHLLIETAAKRTTTKEKFMIKSSTSKPFNKFIHNHPSRTESIDIPAVYPCEKITVRDRL